MKKLQLLLTCWVLLISSSAFSSVDINKAAAEDLALELKGIGIKKAQAIIDYRNAFGEFENIEQLINIKGISAKIIEKNKDNIHLSSQ